MGKIETLRNDIKCKDERIKSLKKENKKLTAERDLLKSDLFKKCILCGKSPITKHSLNGKHKPPFIPLCRDCHDDIETYKEIRKILRRIRKRDNRIKILPEEVIEK